MLPDPRQYASTTQKNAMVQAVYQCIENPADPSAEQLLSLLMEGHLARGDNAAIGVSFSLMPSSTHYQKLWQTLATTVAYPPKQQRFIFAFPVLMVAAASPRISLRAEIPLLGELKAFFNQAGILPAHEVWLSNQLHSAQQLQAISPSEWWQLSQNEAPIPLGGETPSLEIGTEAVYVRYLVGSLNKPSKENIEALQQRGRWMKDIMPLLIQYYAIEGLTLLPIVRPAQALLDSLETGRQCQREMALQINLSQIVRTFREKRQNPEASLRVFNNNTLQIDIKHQERLESVRISITLQDHMQNLVKSIEYLLIEMGIETITQNPNICIVEEISPQQVQNSGLTHSNLN